MARPGYGNEIIQMGIGPVYSMFIILGDTYEEALEIMTTLKEFYGEPKGSVMEVQGCVSALLPEDNNIETITVTARPGFLCRRLEFSVPRGNDIIADYVSKSDFSALLNGLKFYHKLHPNEP